MTKARDLANIGADTADLATDAEVALKAPINNLTFTGTTAFSGNVDHTDITAHQSHLPGHYYHNRSSYASNVYVHYYNNKQETIGNTYLRFKSPSGSKALWANIRRYKMSVTYELLEEFTGTRTNEMPDPEN